MGLQFTAKDAWCTDKEDKDQFIQVDFLLKTRVTRVGTMRRITKDHWVSEYFLQFSDDDNTWNDYLENGQVKVGAYILGFKWLEFSRFDILWSLRPFCSSMTFVLIGCFRDRLKWDLEVWQQISQNKNYKNWNCGNLYDEGQSLPLHIYLLTIVLRFSSYI